MHRPRTFLALAALFFSCVASARADTVTLVDVGQAVAAQAGVYRVHRDVFRNGGHGWERKSPNPYGDGTNYGDATLHFSLGPVVPANGTLLTAMLNWQFSNLTAVTNFNRPDQDNPFNPGAAHAPRVHGSNLLCRSPMPCTPATLDRFAPQAAFWASRITLEGVGTYWFPVSGHRAPTGSINLLDLWSAEELRSHTLSFVFTTQYEMGRPFFRTEGWNADTEFDVFGRSTVDAVARLTATISAPPPQHASTVPEPATVLLLGSGMIGVAARARKRRHRVRA